MDNKNLLRKKLDRYLRFPLMMTVLLVFMNIIVYGINVASGGMVTIFVLLYVLICLYVYVKRRPNIISDLVSFSYAQNCIQNALIKDLAVPYTLVDVNGRILWSNKAFYETIKSDKQHMRKHIQNIFTDITLELLQMESEDNNLRRVHIFQTDRNYEVEIRRIDVNSLLAKEFSEEAQEEEFLFAIYLYDETELVKTLEEKEKIKLVTGHIYIDNYDEAMDSIEEVRRSLLIALIEVYAECRCDY